MNELLVKLAEKISLSLVGGVARNSFEHLELALLNLLNFLKLAVGFLQFLVNLFFLGLKIVHLFVKVFFFLLNPSFLTLNLPAAIREFFFTFVAQAVNLVLAFENRFLLLRFRGLHRVGDNSVGFLFSTSDLFFRHILAVIYTDNDAHGAEN